MSAVLPTGTPEERTEAVEAVAGAISKGRLVVLPTDTVYGVGADAFDPEAVARLLEAKGRGRNMPPPVLIGDAGTVDALVTGLPDYARTLIEHCWPGPLTLIGREQPSLRWDLGDTRGTVAVRMPDHEVALEILRRTGPLAVSSANSTGRPAATSAAAAEEMLGESVEVIVDAGDSPGETPSTILDVTMDRPRILREGVLTVATLDEILAVHDLTVIDEG
ncbi:MAG: threonylcarbamoyl-AMP synthase [Nocardioidaceae bacterium]|nr:threonylcarbamoyl-AMP synthase [Nocardioidaceae bacterium]